MIYQPKPLWGPALVLVAVACGPQKATVQDQRLLPPSSQYCSGVACKRSHADLAVDLKTPKNPSNERDIPISWTAESALAYTLQASRDVDCKQVFEARTTQSGETTFSQLEDGVWYFCLRPAAGTRGVSPNEVLGTLQLTLDRTAPLIQVPADLNLEGASVLDLKVQDLLDFSCDWKSSAANFAVEVAGPGKARLLNIFSGAYALQVKCHDVAGNESQQDFVVQLTEPPVPVNVGELTASAGTDQSWTRPGLLKASATGAKYFSWRLVNGPGDVSFQRPNDLETLVTPSLAGTYTLRFTALSPDGKNAISDDMVLTWTPTPLALKSSFTRAHLQLFTRLQGVASNGSYAFVAREQFGLTVLNISNLANVTTVSNNLLGNTSSQGWAYRLKLVGQTLFVANWDRGLTVVDVKDPTSPQVLGTLPLTNVSDVVVDGTYAYVSLYDDVAKTGGLAIVQIANPSAMTVVKTLDTNGTAASLAKLGSYIYLTHNGMGTFRGLKVIDVSNPSNPRVVKSLVRNAMEDIAIVQGKAYIAAGDQGFEIFDLATPSNPLSLSLTTPAASGTGLYLQGLAIAEGHLFASDYSGARMLVYSIADASKPQAAGSFLTSQNKPALWVQVQGRYAFLSSEARGLEIIEVFD